MQNALEIIGHQPGWHFEIASALQVLVDNVFQQDSTPGVPRETVSVRQQQAGHTRADRAHPNQSHLSRFHQNLSR
jgi:hypothetical protein